MAQKRSDRVRRTSSQSAANTTKAFAAGAVGLVTLAAGPVAQAAAFTVTNLNDAGAGSLRDALTSANTSPGADVIDFQPGLTGTITLTTGQLDVTDSVDIQGPGAGALAVSGNSASRVFYLYSAPALINVSIENLTIRDGAATTGAGIVDFNENLVLDGVTITGNHASTEGGGLFMDGFDYSFTIRNSTLSGNTADGTGGGIYVEDTNDDNVANLIETTVVSGNTATRGGGIYFYDPDSAITFDRITIANNTATDVGGGIFISDTDTDAAIVISNSTISGNSAVAGGGGYFYQPDNPVTLKNVTVSGNHATLGSGGGLFFYDINAPTRFEFVTIVDNDATNIGGGVYVENGSIDIVNSIVANNTAPGSVDLSGSFSVAYSLIEASGGTITDGGGNISGTDPDLAPLANNGGPTQTHLPNPGSPVVDEANLALAPSDTTDQRGSTRPVGSAADMGAVEVDGGTIAFSSPTYLVDENAGSVSLTVTRTGGTDPAEVQYTTTPGTATAGSDYTTTAGTLTFAAGQTSQSIVVPILDDAVVEGPETFTVALSNPDSATLGVPATTTVTINDIEAGALQFSSPTYSVNENGGVLTVTVTRTGGTSGSVSATYATSSGTATSGSDFTPTTGTVTFADGDAAPKTFDVPILPDNLVEGPEAFTLTLSTPTGGATIGPAATAVATIVDAPPVTRTDIPVFGPMGRLLVIIGTALTGVYALTRKRLFGFLFVAMLIGATSHSLFAGTPVTSANTGRHTRLEAGQHESKPEKIRGVIAAIATTSTGTTITFKDGTVLQLGAASTLAVRDRRSGHGRKASVAALQTGQTIVVRTPRTSQSVGNSGSAVRPTLVRILR